MQDSEPGPKPREPRCRQQAEAGVAAGSPSAPWQGRVRGWGVGPGVEGRVGPGHCLGVLNKAPAHLRPGVGVRAGGTPRGRAGSENVLNQGGEQC